MRCHERVPHHASWPLLVTSNMSEGQAYTARVYPRNPCLCSSMGNTQSHLQVIMSAAQADAMARMFANMHVQGAYGQGNYRPDNSWRNNVPAWFAPALNGGQVSAGHRINRVHANHAR